MKKKPNKDVFAPMVFLEDEMSCYEGGYPNERTRAYYETLKAIRDAQRNEILPEDLYRTLGTSSGKSKDLGSVERGYYLANIHYYLFESCSEFVRSKSYKSSVNERVKFFLENADLAELKKSKWFPLNFIRNYLMFLETFYGRHRDGSMNSIMEEYLDLASLVERFGDKTEKEIISLIRIVVKG